MGAIMQLETAYYTPGNGVYCSLIPTFATLNILRKSLALKADWLSPCQWHVTVIYDREADTSPHRFSTLFRQLGSDVEYNATVFGIDWFQSSKDPELGALVILLDSEDMQQLKSMLFDLFNFKSDYAEYRPHLTLVEDVPRPYLMPDISLLIWRTLTFSGFRIESIK